MTIRLYIYSFVLSADLYPSNRRVSLEFANLPPNLTKKVCNITFESSDPALKPLNDKVYVGSGRFIIEQGKPVLVEYKISEVTH